VIQRGNKRGNNSGTISVVMDFHPLSNAWITLAKLFRLRTWDD
jgi:hypothetical protein